MSTNLPPSQPPSQPPLGSQPPHDPTAPEVLDQRDGTSMGAPPRSGGGGRRKGLLIGGGALALALVGGGAWAAMSFLSTGAQPAEALPASVLGYASVDLDPSGGQKIEALKTLNKFPKFKDSVGIGSGDDVRRGIFDSLQKADACPGLDFAKDIDPWLGDRAALAAVKGADGSPQPVVVVQVKDAGKAGSGLQKLKACGSGNAGSGAADTGWVIEGGWAVVAASEELAKTVSADAAKANLADDATFQKWTGETGAAGVATLYAAPGAGAAILEQLGNTMPEQVRSQFTEFKGIAATIRFANGALEMEAAGGVAQDTAGVVGASSVSDQVTSLPDDTAAAFGLSLGKGWVQTALDQFAAGLGGSASTEQLITQVEQATGLSLPEDIETLTAGGVVLSVGPGLDPEALANAADPTQVPVALKLGGDPAQISAIVDKLAAQIPGGPDLIGSTTKGDAVVVGPQQTYREQVAAGGNLGGAKEFTEVVRAGNSPVLFYLNVNAFEPALESLLSSDKDVLANIKPLSAIGVSTSTDGGVSRFVLRIGTDG